MSSTALWCAEDKWTNGWSVPLLNLMFQKLLKKHCKNVFGKNCNGVVTAAAKRFLCMLWNLSYI